MAQTPQLSPEKVLLDSEEVEITDELLKTFKEQKNYPKQLRPKILQYTDPKKRNIKKAALISKNKKGQIVVQEKLDAFCEEFLRNGGNATEAAMTVFNVSSPLVAAQVGSVYLKKAKVLTRIILEKQGYTYGKLINIAAEKAERSRLPDWWDRVMELGDYGNFRTTKGGAPTTNINIVQTEKELFKKYAMDAEEAEVVEEPEVLGEGTEDDSQL